MRILRSVLAVLLLCDSRRFSIPLTFRKRISPTKCYSSRAARAAERSVEIRAVSPVVPSSERAMRAHSLAIASLLVTLKAYSLSMMGLIYAPVHRP